MRFFSVILAVTLLCSVTQRGQADIISFRLTGNGGDGLLGSNVTPDTGSTGYGGMGSSGITFDTVSGVLHVDVGWGSLNGWGDLSGDVTMLHWHGPTMDLPPDSFSQTGPLIINLALALNFDPDFNGGGVNANYLVNPGDVPGLLQGRTYINVHTEQFPTGEIRGYLVRAVPEPAAATAAIVPGLAALVFRRRQRA